MKKNLTLLFIVLLTLCLVSFVFDRILPATAVSAASDPSSEWAVTGPAETEPAPPASSTPPVVYVIIGLVVVLFATVAISPLLLGDGVKP